MKKVALGFLIFIFVLLIFRNMRFIYSQDHLIEVAVLDTSMGSITLKLYPEHAPKTVDNFKQLVKESFYNGCHLYRAEPNFCLQGGAWTVKSKNIAPIPLEYKIPNCKYKVSMARSSDPNSATSEFSIMLKDNSRWLGPGGSDAHGYAVFAEVVDGWDIVDKVMTLPTQKSGSTNLLRDKVIIKEAYLKMVDSSKLNSYDTSDCDTVTKTQG